MGVRGTNMNKGKALCYEQVVVEIKVACCLNWRESRKRDQWNSIEGRRLALHTNSLNLSSYVSPRTTSSTKNLSAETEVNLEALSIIRCGQVPTPPGKKNIIKTWDRSNSTEGWILPCI